MNAARISAGLDVGTSKTCVAVIEVAGTKRRVLGVGVAPTDGMKKGAVTDVGAVAESIRAALGEAAASSGTRLRKVTLGVSGRHVSSSVNYGVVGVSGRDVTERDRQSAIDAAGILYAPVDREILHVIPAEYILDGAEGVRNPVGLPAFRLEARVLVVTASAGELQKLVNACTGAGVQVERRMFGPLASAGSVLNEREKNEGVVFADIGAGVTGVVVFQNGTPRLCAVINAGGANLTNDIAVGMRLTFREAEQVKKQRLSLAATVHRTHAPLVGAAGDGPCGDVDLAGIAGARCSEIVELMKSRILQEAGLSGALLGTVITGGTALLGGFADMAGNILGLPVRVGNPLMIQGLKHEVRSPSFAGALGLALGNGKERCESVSGTAACGARDGAQSAVRRMTEFFRGLNFDKNKKGVRYV